MPTTTKNLITQAQLQKIVNEYKSFVDWLIVNGWNIINGFFNTLFEKYNHQTLPFTQFQNSSNNQKLQQIMQLIKEHRSKTDHKYKKLHYTLIISALKDRINELDYNNGQSLTRKQKINYVIRSWDIMLISYRATGKTLNDKLNNIVSDALRYFSHSVFAHVWLIGEGNSQDGYQRLHSTLSTNGGKTPGVQKIPLNIYLDEKKTCDILIVRYTGSQQEDIHRMLQTGEKYLNNKIWYDTGDAISDIIGRKLRREENKFNCGEFVYTCLKAIDNKIDIDHNALPASYTDQQFLEQIYLTRYYGD